MSLDASPSFARPPLDEVVLGVQFQAPERYNTTFNGDIWNLFREDYPLVEEQPPIPPQIEAFGGHANQGLRINFGEPPAKTRLWFISNDQSHLLQHQEDRLLMNWRNRHRATSYPRHITMAALFKKKLGSLSSYYEERLGGPLLVTQAEVSYINIIPLDSYAEIGEWLSFVKASSINIEGLNANFGQVLTGEGGQPIARMYYELQSVINGSDMRPSLRFSLTCRGRPSGSSIADGLDFITYGRDRIVSDFCHLTTEKAQQFWGRQQ